MRNRIKLSGCYKTATLNSDIIFALNLMPTGSLKRRTPYAIKIPLRNK